jgi:hypothetical protein
MLVVRKQLALCAILLRLCCVSMTLRAQDAQAAQQPQGGAGKSTLRLRYLRNCRRDQLLSATKTVS